MSKNQSRQLRFVKLAVRGKGGVVAAQNQTAADIGAHVLATGGNAVDAAIATAFALTVLEPWTSGLGSVGCMTIWDSRQRRGYVIDFLGVTPRRMINATLGEPDAGLFAKAGASDDPLDAYRTIAVPGQPAGLWAAHMFGSKPWTALIGPAIELSEFGLDIDSFTFLIVVLAATGFAQFPATREWFTPPDLPSSLDRIESEFRWRNPALTATLKALAERGGRDYYEGMLARALLNDLGLGGSAIDKVDLSGYRTRLVDPTVVAHSGKRLLMPPEDGLTKILAEALAGLEGLGHALDVSAYATYAKVVSAAHDAGAAAFPDTGVREWSSHASVIDIDGNMVCISQSLGPLFGSRVVLPETGILMNSCGATLMREEAGRHAIPPATRTINFLLPVLGLTGERPWLAIGVSGDRHIVPTLLQLVSLQSDMGFSLESAFRQPRVDVEKAGKVFIDPNASSDIKKAIREKFAVIEQRRSTFPFSQPCAIAVAVDQVSGEQVAMTETTEPRAGASAAA
jgi:gamma-glutamyltranspeptidase/glutathione hydrolase